MRQVRATAAHQPPKRPPLQVDVGELVTVGDRDTDWPAFVFVAAATGAGWVPSRHLSADRGSATVQVRYDTTELTTRDGELLDVLAEDTTSGWLWCRAADGRAGWIPTRTVEPSV